jgi:hypothetical protein
MVRVRFASLSLQKSEHGVVCHFTIAQDLHHQAGSYGLTPMNRHDRTASVGMLQEVVAASHADRLETVSVQRCYDLPAGEPREPGHPSTQTR